MTDEERRKAQRTSVELKETEDAFAKLRTGFVERLFKTGPTDHEEREQLYMAVKVLDTVRDAMTAVVRSASDTIKIDDYVDAFHKKKEVTNG